MNAGLTISFADVRLMQFAPRGNDEIATLARAFERMRRSLEKSMVLLQR
jgi:HAMP domain-containing protein